jgi:putative flavoprotein involved in K+ transport
MPISYDTLVVGAGQAGLAAGYYLRQANLRFAILEAGSGPAGAWSNYYDSLRLFSPARYSGLPGLPFPGAPDRYPTREEVIGYLRDYTASFRLPVIANSSVEEVHKVHKGFEAVAGSGATFGAHTIIAATGSFNRPYRPQLAGQERYRGHILHSADYRGPAPFRNRRVVVVGGGNSGVQIAVELAQVAHVTMATRGPLKFVPQRILGRDIHFWAQLSGVAWLPFGRWRDLREVTPVLDTGAYARAIAQGRPDHRLMFSAFTEEGVRWPDGSTEPVDAVIYATGYRPNFDYLRGLDALDAGGRPIQRAGVSRTTPGLYFVGVAAQRTLTSATLRGVGPDARYVVGHLRRYLDRVGYNDPTR